MYINNEYWYVLLASPTNPSLRRSDGSYALGSCDDITKTIYLNQNLDMKMMKKVLSHEITHAAMFSYNIDLSIEQEELLADLMSLYGQEIIDKTNLFFKDIKKIRETR